MNDKTFQKSIEPDAPDAYQDVENNALNAREVNEKNHNILMSELFYNDPELTKMMQEYKDIENRFLNLKLQVDSQNLSDEEYSKQMLEAYKVLDDHHKELGILIQIRKNQLVGLGPENLERIRQEEKALHGERTETTYVPTIALIEKILGDNIKHKTILEIGPGREGISILDRFAKKGARALAIDVGNPGMEILSKYPKVEFYQGRWEDVGEILNGQTVDVIYIHYMHPYPERGGRFENDEEEFAEHVTLEMDKILTNGGIFIIHHPDLGARAYSGPYGTFERLGYNKEDFVDIRIESALMDKFSDYLKKLKIHQKLVIL